MVLEEGPGRRAAEAVLGGIVPLWVRGELVQHVGEADHLRREGTVFSEPRAKVSMLPFSNASASVHGFVL